MIKPSDFDWSTARERFMHVFNCGTFFCGDYGNRANDLANACQVLHDQTGNGKDLNELLDIRMDWIGGKGLTIRSMLRNYGNHLDDLVFELAGLAEAE